MTRGVVLAVVSLAVVRGAAPPDPNLPGGTRLRIINACPHEPMWIARLAGGGMGPGAQNVKIDPGAFHDFVTQNGLAAARFWPKMGCDQAGDHCTLGGSGGPGEQCVGPNGDYSKCAPPLDTKFEGSFGQLGQPCDPKSPATMLGCDYIDVSLVDGWTLPFKLTINGVCLGKNDQPITAIDCSALTLDKCPTGEHLGPLTLSMRAVNPHTGKVAGCYAPCLKLIDDKWNNAIARGKHPNDDGISKFCCPAPKESSASCKAGPIKTTQYVQQVHATCPGVYSYAFDDGMGLMRCTAGALYQMTYYCPSAGLAFPLRPPPPPATTPKAPPPAGTVPHPAPPHGEPALGAKPAPVARPAAAPAGEVPHPALPLGKQAFGVKPAPAARTAAPPAEAAPAAKPAPVVAAKPAARPPLAVMKADVAGIDRSALQAAQAQKSAEAAAAQQASTRAQGYLQKFETRLHASRLNDQPGLLRAFIEGLLGAFVVVAVLIGGAGLVAVLWKRTRRRNSYWPLARPLAAAPLSNEGI
mmetsp:Transcript_63/g.127  ORF Transcript_63/g.127 Transcript_63/m.127 type:complete len:525 (-) Transcript_63:20-1594(-)